MNSGGTEIVDGDGTGVPAAIVPEVWPGGHADATRRATDGRGAGAWRAIGPFGGKVAGDRHVVVGGDEGVTTDRARPKDAREGPVHRPDTGDGVVVVGEDGDLTTDRARPKDAGEGPVHRPDTGDGVVVVGEDGDLTTDRARPKDAGEGPVHRAEAGAE